MGIEKGGIDVGNLVNGTDRLENKVTGIIDKIEDLVNTATKASNTNLKIKMDLSAVDKGSKALEKYNKLLVTTKRNGEIKVNSNVRSKTNNYYQSQERAEKDLIEKWNKYVSDANSGLYNFGAYNKDDGSKDKANDIYRYANAFEALGGDLSKVNPKLKEFVETLRTTKLTTDPNNDYTVEKFRELFSLLDDLRKEGAVSIDDSFAPLTESLPKVIDLLDSVAEKAKQARKETSNVPSTESETQEEKSEHKEISRKTRDQVERELRSKYKGNSRDSYYDADEVIDYYASRESRNKSGIAKYVSALEEMKESAKSYIDEILNYENKLIDVKNGKDITNWRGELETEDSLSETLERRKSDYKDYLDYIEILQEKINEIATTPVENDGSVLSKQVETISAQLSILNERIDSIRKSFQDIDLSKLSGEAKDIGNFSLTEEQIKSISELFDGLKSEITEIRNAFGTIDDESGFKPLLSSVTDISESLLGLKSVFVDVGEGQEFSPLLSMINEITEAIKKLEQAVSKIKLNINLDANMVDEAGLMKVQGRKQDLLRVYQEQFSAMKSFDVGSNKVVSGMFGKKRNDTLISDLNKSILEFDETIYDNIDQKIKAYESMINRMKQVAKEQYGEDVYDGMDSRYKKNVTTAKGNLSRAMNSMGKGSQDEISNLFGKADLSKVEAQLDAISSSLDKIVQAAEKFREAFSVNVEFEKIGANFKEEQNTVDNAVASEKTSLETLKEKVNEVTTAVDKKSTAFTQEKIAVETAVNYEKTKLDELIEKIKEVARTISELGDKPIDIKIDEKTEEVLSRLKTTLGGDWGTDLQTLSTTLSGLNVTASTAKNMQSLANAILTLKSNLNNLGDGGAAFLSSINELVGKASALENLATVLKATKQEIEKAKKEIEPDKSVVDKDYFDSNVASMRDSATQTLSDKYSDVKFPEITRSEKGIVTLTAAIKDADGEWKKFTGHINSEGKLSTSGITELAKSKTDELKNIDDVTKAQEKAAEKEEKKKQEVQAKKDQREFDRSADADYLETLKKAKKVETEYQRLKAKSDAELATSKELEKLQLLTAQRESYNEKIKETNAITKKEQDELKKYTDLRDSEYAKKNQDTLLQHINLEEFKQTSVSVKSAEEAFESLKNKGVSGLDDRLNEARQKLDDLNIEFARGSKNTEQYEKAVENLLKDLGNIKAVVGKNLTEEQGKDAITNYVENAVGKASGKNLKMSDIKIDGNTLKVSSEFLNANKNAVKLLTTLNLLNGELRETMEIGGKGNFLSKMFDGWKQGLANVTRYVSTFVGFYEVINLMKQGAQTVIEFDTALTEMRKVSDETVGSLKNFQAESFGIADSVGTTALQIQQSTADFMRLGETLDEASESAKTANILLNVSEFDSIEDATTSLIAMKAAYDEIDQTAIVDKLNLIGNTYSISTDGLATALQDSASALKTAGADIDSAIALITAGNQVVQDPTKVGSGMRTIALRLAGKQNMPEHIVICGYFKY